MEFSHHAVQRCTQQGIRAQQVEWLRNIGVRIWKYGAEVYLFDHDAFNCLMQSVCSHDRQLAEKSRNSYAVVSADRVITVGIAMLFCLISRSARIAAFGPVSILKAFRANLAPVR